MIRWMTAGLLLLMASASCALAQADPDSVKRRNDCRLAGQVLSTGQPATHYDWALEKAWHCPDAAAGIASLLRASTASRDAAALEALTRPTQRLRDGQIFSVAIAIVGNKAASQEARVYAARTLLYALRPDSGIEYDALIDRNQQCYGGGPGPHQSYTNGTTPLPGDYAQQVRSMGERIMRDASETPQLRHVGMCLYLAREAVRGH